MPNVDLPPKLVSLFTTTLSQSIGTGANETITFTSTARLLQGEYITVTLDRVNANGQPTLELREVIHGKISGNNLVDYVRGYDDTQPQAHNSGAIVEVILTAADWNKMVDKLQNLNIDYATQQEAEDGEENTRVMTPLRVKQSIAINKKNAPQNITIQSGNGVLKIRNESDTCLNHQATLSDNATISITAESGDYFRLHLNNSASEEVVVTFTSSVSDDTIKIVGGETDTSVKLPAGKSADIYFDKFDKKITGHVEMGE